MEQKNGQMDRPGKIRHVTCKDSCIVIVLKSMTWAQTAYISMWEVDAG